MYVAPDPAPPESRLDVFEVGSITVAMLSEVDNEHAWIQSTEITPVEQ